MPNCLSLTKTGMNLVSDMSCPLRQSSQFPLQFWKKTAAGGDRIWSYAAKDQGMPAATRGQERGTGQILPLSPQEGTNLANTFILNW